MGLHSPLTIGQVITPTENLGARIYPLVNKKINLVKGLLAEYAHNEHFDLAGWVYTLTDTTAHYDRIFSGLKQDDKRALHDPSGKLSGTHTISANQFYLWSSEKDVIIHCFIESEPESLSSIYRGAVSFRRAIEAQKNGINIFMPSKFDDGWCMYRSAALRYASV